MLDDQDVHDRIISGGRRRCVKEATVLSGVAESHIESLGEILADYPGVTTTLKRLEFKARCEPLIHRWSQLKTAITQLKVCGTCSGKAAQTHGLACASHY
ncbi:unnamed protein product [Zymoseptoria tritici ST99CH_3D1]|nr:unnamed protein product [Zymoseptoria tritici ST99CH_3D1]